MRLISGYDNKYDTYITDDGHVFVDRARGFEELQQESSSGGYYRVKIAYKPRLVHRLVAELYISNPDNKPCVNHKDGVKLNNSVENLEWVTYSENMRHAFDTGLYPKRKGSKQNNAKLTEEIVAVIKRRLKNGDSGYAMAKEYGVAHGRIYDIKHGRSWSHV